MKDAWTHIVEVKADARAEGGPISMLSVRKKAFAPCHDENSTCH